METWAKSLCRLSTGTFVTLQGFWRPSPPGKEQSHELQAERVTITGAADAEVSLILGQEYAIFRTSYDLITNATSVELPDSEEIPDIRIPPYNPTSQATPSHTGSAHSDSFRV